MIIPARWASQLGASAIGRATTVDNPGRHAIPETDQQADPTWWTAAISGRTPELEVNIPCLDLKRSMGSTTTLSLNQTKQIEQLTTLQPPATVYRGKTWSERW